MSDTNFVFTDLPEETTPEFQHRVSSQETRTKLVEIRPTKSARSSRLSPSTIGKFALSLLIAFAASHSKASALEKTDDIDTNRPSFMFSPLVVPRSSIQLENGLLYSHIPLGGRDAFDLSETQIRVGLTDRTEFQMFVPNFFLIRRQNEDTFTGVSDLGEVGFKHQLPALKKFQLSLIPSVNLPTGNRFISGPGVQAVLRAPWSYPLSKKVSLMGMNSLLVLNSGRNLQYQPNLMLTGAVGCKASVFAEYAGFFTQDFPSIQLAHFGTLYRPKRNHQIDVHFGFGLDKTSPAAFVGAGYSFRFDSLSW